MEKDDTINFDDLLNKAVTIIGTKKQIVNFALPHNTNYRKNELVDKSTSKARVESLSDTKFLFPELAFRPPVVFVGMSSSCFVTKKKDGKIYNRTDMMQSLTPPVWKLQRNVKMGAPVLLAISTTFSPENYSRDIDSHNQRASRSEFPLGVDKCLYCWQTSYFLKGDFLTFQKDSCSNQIYLYIERKFGLGTYLPRF